MGDAPYIGSRLGDGPIFEVALSQLDAKERPGIKTRDRLSSPGLMRLRHYTSSLNFESGVDVKGYR